MNLLLPAPLDFGFDATVRSHGWYDLAPFRYDGNKVLTAVVEVEPDRAAVLRLDEPAPGGVRVRVEGGVAAQRPRIEALVRSMLQLDQDLAPLHAALAAAKEGDYRWVREIGAGRLLRSPTAFEDAVKVLLTTNCSWSATRGMVHRLVLALGAPGPGAARAFPTAARMAAQPASFYRDHVRAGYRAEALRALASAVASGRLAIERWREPGRATADLRAEILSLRGFGPYAADQMLRLAGHFDHPALDSWMRVKWRQLHPRSKATDAAILRRYSARYGRFAGLVLWLDLTRDWHAPDGSSAWP